MIPPTSVRRRHVYYVSGFDPNGPARYHKLYSDGARQQSAVSGASIAVGSRKRIDADTMEWSVLYRDSAEQMVSPEEPMVETTYLFPRWDHIIRQYWWQDRWPQLRDVLRTSWQYARTGAMWKMYRQAWRPFVSLFAPFFLMLVLLPGIALGLWTCVGLALALQTGAPLAQPLASVVVMAVLALVWARRARRYWRTMWVLRSHAFAGRMGGEGVPTMESRMDAMAADICLLARDAADDEILVVGHSLGTMMAVSVLARALRRDPHLMEHGTSIGLLTLGHCTPLLSNLPQAQGFRDELATLAQSSKLCWVDFSDPLDDYGFAGVSPIAAAGLESPRANHPQMRSPEFARLFEAGPQQQARMNQHEIHQNYLCANVRADLYDYFAITGGPLTLAGRFWRR